MNGIDAESSTLVQLYEFKWTAPILSEATQISLVPVSIKDIVTGETYGNEVQVFRW